MRIRLLFMVMVLCVFGCAQAVNIGYCAGEAAKSGSFSVGGNRNVSGAVYLTPSYLAPYDGFEIKALRGALSSKVNLDRLTLWVREDLDGSNLAEATVTSSSSPSLAKGWIEAELTEAYTIDASKGLYLGMTYHQKGESKAFSLIGNGFENSFFASTDESGWTDRHEDGILSVEAVVDGGSMPEFDLALLDAWLDTSSSPEFNVASVRVANSGRNAVSGFTLEYSYADDEEGTLSIHYALDIDSGEKAEVTAEIPKTGDVFVNPLGVRIAGIDNGEDSYDGNDAVVARIPSRKKVLVEEFTTERCSNCPRVAQYIHDVCAEEAYKDNVVVVCHHAGFYTDWLTQPCDEEIGWIYGCGYAPAVMYDRTALPNGEMAETPDTKDLRDAFNRQLAVEPSVGISLMATLSPDGGEVKVNVSLKREKPLDMSSPCLTVYLTEDNIKPIRQSGDKDNTHIHNHVIRAYNSTWGERIDWNGSGYTASYSFEVDSRWKTEDLKVVAMVNNYDSANTANNKVDNVEICGISIGTGVAALDSTEIQAEAYYDLAGRPVAPDSKGFVVKTVRYSDGRSESSKVFNP